MNDYTQNKTIILSAPSGAGKSTIIRHLLALWPQLRLSVSATNRSPRPDEENGKHYHFISTETFMHYVNSGEFVEWEEVYEGRYYGTLKAELDKIAREGGYPVFDVDVVGGLNLKKNFKDAAYAIFVQPPSIEVLRERLQKRGTESEKDLETRLRKAASELAFADRYDDIVINDNLEHAVALVAQKVENFLKA